MLKKPRTLKFRIALLSFLIMFLTVFGIMAVEYILQVTTPAVGTVITVEAPTEITNEEFIERAQKEINFQQQMRFLWLITISTLILLIGMFIIYWLIKRELKPLGDLKENMDKMDFNSEEQHLLEVNNKSEEIQSLTTTYNMMISNLKKTYESQKRFSQNAAHELRTPITTMKTSLQVNKMLNIKYDKETEELLQVLESQVLRMEDLIGGLLLLNSKSQLRKEEIHLRVLVEKILSLLQTSIKEKNITVTIKGDSRINTDAKILTLILKNIIENAIRYNNVGGYITIDLEDKISVSDTGKGIGEKDQSHIFSPFYCVDDSRSKAFGGLGLGLAIVKESVAFLGFTITLKSQLGKGSTFEINFK